MESAHNLEYFHNKPEIVKELPGFRQKLYFQLVKVLLKSNNFIKTWIAIKQIPPQAYQAHAKFLFSDVTRTLFLPPIKRNRITFYPPADRLKNISIEEFSLADSLYVNYRKTTDVRYLDNLCATLYRRKSKSDNDTTDTRQPFSKILIERDVKFFQKLNHKKKLAILYAYAGCRNAIAAAHPHVFPAPQTLVDPDGNPIKQQSGEYVPFGKLIQHKINYDPSKLEPTLKLNAWAFLGNYENELVEIKNLKK
ncbi:hypothetical protein [Aequorivita echinoideorum]|nr:hypothetical protein [Aequorivita echinoideorum]